MPITSGGGVNSTMIQKIIQYFSIEANNIADKASSIGANIYMNKVYASTKINNSDDVVAGYEAKVEEQKNINAIAKKYMAYCEKRWANLKISGSKNAQSLDEVLALANFEELTARASEDKLDTINKLKEELNRLQQWDTHGGMDNIEQDITIPACAKAKKFRDESSERYEEYENKLEEAKKTADSSNVSDKVKEGIDAVDERLRMRDEQLGWFNSILTPSSALILELQKSLADYNPKDERYEKFENYNEQLNLKSSKKVNNQAVLGLDVGTQLLENFAYFVLPGAQGLYNALSNTGDGTRDLLCAAQAADKASSFIGFVWDGFVCKAAAKNDVVFGVFYTSYLVNKFIQFLPVLITSVAAILACVGYLITLCKYYYISPFVVAFALTTKRVDKIINFLITGITIFFKPVLIVLFIYLALFLYSFISDVFVFAGLSQFNILPRSVTDITSVLTFGIIKAFLLILGCIASCYVIWKTIMTGPDWTFKLLGLDKDSDNTIVQGLGNKLENRATIV